jgi:hypothetical protein
MQIRGNPVVRRGIENRAGDRQLSIVVVVATRIRSSSTPGGRGERSTGLDSLQWIRR